VVGKGTKTAQRKKVASYKLQCTASNVDRFFGMTQVTKETNIVPILSRVIKYIIVVITSVTVFSCTPNCIQLPGVKVNSI
jgi:hypothetical protein